MKKGYLFLVFLFLLNLSAIGQISYGGKPLSFEQTMFKAGIAEFVTPVVDYQQMIKEDLETGRGKPFRYGKVHDVNINPENAGTWQTLANGDKIWQLKIKSTGAYSLSLMFDNYKLNEGTRVFIYSIDKKMLIGSFTQKNNKKNNWFSTVPVAGEEIIIELNVLAGVDYGKLNISGIVHDYKGAFGLKLGFNDSGSCNVNINCPEGADWQVEKRAVAKYTYKEGGSTYLCSGSLINNTASDAKAYFLTAHHCVDTNTVANTAVFWFNYESESCVAGSNPTYQSISSADLVATGTNSYGTNLDFSLLELSEVPPAEYNVIYAGWNRALTPATNTTCIHHPQGDIKKISLDYEAPTIENYGEGYLTDSHWNIAEWDVGTTEGGSSGSPLFDQNHLIIGDLTGGDASCSYNFNDYYARFDLSWDYYSDPSKHLKTWLDPLNTGVEKLYGFDPNAITEGLDAALQNVLSPDLEYCNAGEITPRVIIRNNGTLTLTSAVIKYQVNEDSEVLIPWSGNLATNESDEVVFTDVFLPAGDVEFKAFITSPNGSVDQNMSNDTIIKTIFGHQVIEEFIIEGTSDICKENFLAEYSVGVLGDYKWNAVGGEITGADSLQNIEIQWDEWGERYLDVNVSNLCNSVDAETLEIDVVEQSLSLTISLDGAVDSVCWYLKDQSGEIVAQGCGLPVSDEYTTKICVSRGHYTLEIESGLSGVKNYSLNRISDNQVIVSGTGNQSADFYLNAAIGTAEINLYPNPAASEIAIEASFIELYENATYAIFNLKGAALTPYLLFDERKVIDVSTLQPGFYIVKVQSLYGEFTQKFVKP